ncbi:hypothetical protein Tco_0739370 [Tanacetum coccineum]
MINDSRTNNNNHLVQAINNQSFEINDLKVQLQDKLHVINELNHWLAQCELLVIDSRIHKIEDENVSLAFQVSSLVKEREHILLYKKLYDLIKQTREKTKLQTDSLQQKLNDQISQNNKLRAQLRGKFSESQMNHNGTSVNTKLSKPSTSGTKLYSVTLLPKTKVIPKVVKKNDLSKLVTSHLTTNKIIEKCTIVLALVLLALSLKAGMISGLPLQAIERTISLTKSKLYNASSSKPKSNTKNDRILQPSSRSKKNKIEAHHRKFKSSANKNNHVSDCNSNVKNVALSKNSDIIFLSCNEWEHVPLLPAMLEGAAEDQGEGSAIPAKPHHTPIDPIPSTSQPSIPSTIEPPHSSSPSVEVKTEGAATTTSGLDAGMDSGNIYESPLRSHKVPLSEGNTSRSAEDSLQLKELMAIVPKMKVKSLEVALKRMSKRVILSDSKDEETENPRRKIHDIDDYPLVSLVRESMKEKEADFVTPIKASASGEAQEEDISPIILEAAQTLSYVVSQSVSTYKRRAKLANKGKEIGTGLDFFSAAKERLNSAKVEVNTKVNSGSAGVNTGNTLVSTPSVVQTVNVMIPSPIKKAKARRNKPVTQAEQRTYMSTYLKNQGTWKLTQLKKLTFAELKEEFKKLVRRIESFVPKDSEIEKTIVKRTGIEIQTETSKKQKIAVEDVSITEEKVEVTAQYETKEEREAHIKDKVTNSSSGSDIGIDAIPTATKPPSVVDWKIILQPGQKAIYQIIRRDRFDKLYISFGAILKDFSKDDLTKLYRFVIKKYGANRPEEMYDRVLWGDLKTMFDTSLSDDAIWSWPLQQKMVNWRIMILV